MTLYIPLMYHNVCLTVFSFVKLLLESVNFNQESMDSIMRDCMGAISIYVLIYCTGRSKRVEGEEQENDFL